ncbi:hypothetical protein GCM10023196_037040 [Actinoallomurus vinaceus]|uniref:Uncharacterized protein n=1 Tax=Actinoallomurus vinaceus TaxID=1080074 RepID=A0ABP8UDW8_9ACTN
MRLTPQFNGERSDHDRTCGYGTPENHCGKPATWHVLWTVDGTNSLDCDEHMADAEKQWVFYGRHRLGPHCLHPEALFYEDRCEVPGGPRQVDLTVREDAPPWLLPEGLSR